MEEPTNKRKIQIAIDMRIVVISLVIIILAMLLSWRPWSGPASDRTISVTGNATLKSAPDEYVFYPNYDFKNSDKQAALDELSAKSQVIVDKLKELGVADEKIQTNSSGYDRPLYYTEPDSDQTTYSLQLVITVGSSELAQKVQDYLVSTAPSGSVSPQAGFSDTKQKELQSQARDEATKDARAKADQSASNLGFKVGAVKTISDGTGFDTVMPLEKATSSYLNDSSVSSSLSVQPGEQELSYSVTVVYFIK